MCWWCTKIRANNAQYPNKTPARFNPNLLCRKKKKKNNHPIKKQCQRKNIPDRVEALLELWSTLSRHENKNPKWKCIGIEKSRLSSEHFHLGPTCTCSLRWQRSAFLQAIGGIVEWIEQNQYVMQYACVRGQQRHVDTNNWGQKEKQNNSNRVIWPRFECACFIDCNLIDRCSCFLIAMNKNAGIDATATLKACNSSCENEIYIPRANHFFNTFHILS